MTRKANIREGERLSQSAAGWESIRTYDVTDLSGTVSRMLYRALQDSGIPRRGAPHPHVPGIVVTDRTAEPMGPTHVRVTLRYRLPAADDDPRGGASQVRRRLVTNSETEETVRDAAGNVMGVDYTGFSIGSDGTSTSVSIRSQVRRAEVLRPRRTRYITIIVDDIREADAVAREVAGRVNSVRWGEDPAHTWLCLGADSREVNQGAQHEVDFSFVHRSPDWRYRPAVLVNGRVPSDISDTNGEGVFEVYSPIDFARHGLTW